MPSTFKVATLKFYKVEALPKKTLTRLCDFLKVLNLEILIIEDLGQITLLNYFSH